MRGGRERGEDREREREGGGREERDKEKVLTHHFFVVAVHEQ